jgi:hypothetical protein
LGRDTGGGREGDKCTEIFLANIEAVEFSKVIT